MQLTKVVTHPKKWTIYIWGWIKSGEATFCASCTVFSPSETST